MFHFHYIGHFDPHDFLDLSKGYSKPKVQLPISRLAAERVLANFDTEIAEYVSYEDAGYVVCSWAYAPHRLWESIGRFAVALAESECAVVMNEPPGWLITYPEHARLAQEEFWVKWFSESRIAKERGV